jgi:hypothetical protein
MCTQDRQRKFLYYVIVIETIFLPGYPLNMTVKLHMYNKHVDLDGMVAYFCPPLVR